METLGDGDGPIDLHEYRHGLKLRKRTRETSLWSNERGYACPACGERFAGLLTSEKTHTSFAPDGAAPFCVVREPERILVFRH